MRKQIEIRYYKGEEILKKQDGKVSNENHLITLDYNDINYKTNLENLKTFGLCKVEVVGFYEGSEKRNATKEEIESVDSIFRIEETSLSAEQIQINELKAMVEKLTKEPKASKEPKAPKQDELDLNVESK